MTDTLEANSSITKDAFRKTTYDRLIEFFHLEPSDTASLVNNIKNLWNECHAVSALSSKLGISDYRTRQVISALYPDYHPDEDYQHKSGINNKTEIKLFTYFGLGHGQSNILYKKVYLLWHREGTIHSLSERLGISEYHASRLINYIRNNTIISPFREPNMKLSKIFEVFSLYKKLGTLEAVGKELGVTKERVRQILEEGKKYNLVYYKPTLIEQASNLSRKVKKRDLENLFINNQSENKVFKLLKNTYGNEITEEALAELVRLYGIDLKSLVLTARKNKCLLEYASIVQEIGHHPTATEMSKRKNWRKLWGRIDSIWGSMNNFRRDLGIPIIKKGNPRCGELLRGWREIAIERKKEKKRMLLDFINHSGSVTNKEISQKLPLRGPSLDQYLCELRNENLVNWSRKKNKITYSKKVFSLDNS